MKKVIAFILVIVAILIVMNTVKTQLSSMPTDTRMVDKISTTDKRLENLENTNQQIWGDWYTFNPSLFSYNASNIVQVDTSLIVEDFFQIGDKIHLVQGSGDEYFYIAKVDTGNNRITLNAGSDYTYGNTAITEFETSRAVNPQGFPSSFAYTVSWTQVGGAGFTVDSSTAIYRMQGSYMTIIVDASLSWSSAPFFVYASLPFPNGEVGQDITQMVSGIGGAGIVPQRATLYDGDDKVSMVDDSFGALTWAVNFTFFYPQVP